MNNQHELEKRVAKLELQLAILTMALKSMSRLEGFHDALRIAEWEIGEESARLSEKE